MRKKTPLLYGLLFFCSFLMSPIYGQSPVKEIKMSPEEAKLSMVNDLDYSYLVEIAGPNGYYWNQTVEQTNDIKLSNRRADGEKFQDGQYTLQVTPVFTLSDEDRNVLQAMREKNDQAGITAFREAKNLPERVEQFFVGFRIVEGHFISSEEKEGGMKMPIMSSDPNRNHPSLYASVNRVEGVFPVRATDNSSMEDAQVFTQDVIAQGSLCVGIDCTTSESFGFDTERFKENNLRIHFNDTSASASFPGNDWRITINDSDNGGANYFGIDDATAGTRPFTISAGAGNNAIYVKNNGDVGLGTASPVVELQVTDGDTPTLRLEQNGANGWTPQTWDVAGNETNFFVRDVNNSSNLIFRLRAGAPANSIFVQNNGRVGLGTETPSEALHLKSGNARIESGGLQMNNGSIDMTLGNLTMDQGNVGIDVGNVTIEEGNVVVGEGSIGINVTPTSSLHVSGSSTLQGTAEIIGNLTVKNGTSSNFMNTAATTTVLSIDATNSRVGIGTNTPGHVLEVTSNDVVKPSGGDWLGASDRRLKKDIKDFNDGLSTILKMHPVKYHYNGKLNLPTDEEFVGIIAQEMQEIAPYTIKPLNHEKEKGYLAYDGSAVTYILVNAVQEQQEIIESQDSRIEQLEQEVAELRQLKQEFAQLAELVRKNAETDSAEGAASLSEDK